MTLCITWELTPLSPPVPHRHCPGCNAARPFLCSGKIRLNANGARLDAWLIYRCADCDRTWNLPILDRVRRSSLSSAELAALHHSDPALVRRHACDLARLARHSSHVKPATTCIRKRAIGQWSATWTDLALTIRAQDLPGPRLDRLLASELRLSRGELSRLANSGALHGPSPLGRPVQGEVTLTLRAHLLSPAQHCAITAGLVDSPGAPPP